MERDFELIIHVLKRTRVAFVGFGVFAVGLAILASVTFIVRLLPIFANSNEILRIFFVLFYVAGILVFLRYGITFLITGIRWWNVEQSPLFILLKEYPYQIVWIFENPLKDKRQEPTVNIWLADGEKYRLFTKQEDVSNLIQALSSFSPNARLGYQAEWVKEYKQDPSTFGAIAKIENQ